MEDLQVPTRRISVELLTVSGERLFGSLFAPESPFPAAQTEYVLQVLNDQRAFLPIGIEGNTGRHTICSKRFVLRVKLTTSGAGAEEHVDSPPEPETSACDPDDDLCSLLMSDGHRIVGRVAVETRWSSSRLVDKLNQAQQFIPIATEHGIEFVHRDHVIRVD